MTSLVGSLSERPQLLLTIFPTLVFSLNRQSGREEIIGSRESWHTDKTLSVMRWSLCPCEITIAHHLGHVCEMRVETTCFSFLIKICSLANLRLIAYVWRGFENNSNTWFTLQLLPLSSNVLGLSTAFSNILEYCSLFQRYLFQMTTHASSSNP